jgi:hypothetical protein
MVSAYWVWPFFICHYHDSCSLKVNILFFPKYYVNRRIYSEGDFCIIGAIVHNLGARSHNPLKYKCQNSK